MPGLYSDSIFWIEVNKIRPNPYQPRKEFDEEKLHDLSESIRQYGVLQPLVVTRHETQKPDGGIFVEYELIAGERRLRAAKLAGVTQVPVVIRTGEQDNKLKLELAIIENLQREDLNAVDRAKAFQRFIDEFNYKHNEIAKRVGKSREYVSNTLRLLTLPEEILNALSAGHISEGHTRPLLMLKDKPEEQMTLFKEITHKKLTVREAEAIARRAAQEKIRKKSRKFDPEIIKMEETLTETLGTRVHIEPREVGGKVMIEFFSDDDLRELLRVMNERAAQAARAQRDTSAHQALREAIGADPHTDHTQSTPDESNDSELVYTNPPEPSERVTPQRPVPPPPQPHIQTPPPQTNERELFVNETVDISNDTTPDVREQSRRLAEQMHDILNEQPQYHNDSERERITPEEIQPERYGNETMTPSHDAVQKHHEASNTPSVETRLDSHESSPGSQPPQAHPQRSDDTPDDDDLYSVRNFSI